MMGMRKKRIAISHYYINLQGDKSEEGGEIEVCWCRTSAAAANCRHMQHHSYTHDLFIQTVLKPVI